MLAKNSLEEELAKAGALHHLTIVEAREAATIAYQRLLKEVPRRTDNAAPNLYDMVSYLIERSNGLGFSFHSSIKDKRIIFSIESDFNGSTVIPLLLELLLAQIFENLGNLESEISHSEKITVVSIKLA